MMLGLVTLIWRELKKWWKSWFSVLATVSRPLAWLLLFGKAFNPLKIVQGSGAGALSVNLGGSPDYFSFLAAGMLSVMMFQLSMRGMVSLVFDRYLGFLDRVLASPVRRETVLLSKVLASVVRGMIQVVVMLVIAILLGMQLEPGFGLIEALACFIVLLGVGVGLASIFVSIGAFIKRWETQEVVTTGLALPIMFTSNVFFPLRTAPWWLQPIALLNPITHSTDVIRALLYGGTPALGTILFDVEFLAAFLILSLLLLVVTARKMGSSR